MIEIDRYDPRKDKQELKELFKDFIQNKCYFDSNWDKFEKELNKRVLDLQQRNSMVIAREDGKLVGWVTYTRFRDYLGNDRYLVHQVMTRKEDAYRKGIEEKIILELQKYLKKTMNVDKVFFICPDSDSAKRSLFLKLDIKKSDQVWYEKEI
jgi:L-amino acid N-acyltransferase YncA